MTVPLSSRTNAPRAIPVALLAGGGNAPNVNDPEVWGLLATKGSEALTLATINGIGEMPPRGRCDTCTDEQIKAAVDYMIEQAE